MENFEWFKDKKTQEEAKKIVAGLDLSKNNEDSLEEDYKTRKIIGKKEDEENSEKLAEMEKEAKKFQDLQNQEIVEIKNELYDKATLLQKVSNLFEELNQKLEKRKVLNKKNFILHQNSLVGENSGSENEIEKEIISLNKQISALENNIKYEAVSESDLERLQLEYEKLNERYEFLEKTWFPENPSLN